MTTYKDLEKKSLPLIEAYHNDLIVHDKREIEENPVPFLHFTGKTGTHLEKFIPADEYPLGRFKYLFGYSTREEILDAMVPIVTGMKTRYGRGDLAMYFDGKNLREISYQKAEGIAREYTRRIYSEWEAPLQIAVNG